MRDQSKPKPADCMAAVTCAALARKAGARKIVVTDLQDFPLQLALSMGAHEGINVAAEAARLRCAVPCHLRLLLFLKYGDTHLCLCVFWHS